ncbi:MAG: FAD-binding oxidoreductase [Flavobacteriales bacterium]|nr:FAD-binding oxidoreductase [Flavobacteriales bacterium]
MLSPWESATFHARPHLVVVGAGIVGLFTALHYKRKNPGHVVLVLEEGPFPQGASVKNAGFACFGSPSELLADMVAEGEAAALARVAERWHGLHELRAELGDQAIGYEPTGGHELFHVNDPLYTRVAEGFGPLNELLRPLTGGDTYTWENELPTRLGMAPGLRCARTVHEGALNSGHLIRMLLAKVISEGVLVRTSARVVNLAEEADVVDIRLQDGSCVKCGKVVVATNGRASDLLPELDIRPARGQVLLTTPIPGLALRGTFHMHEGFYYFRDHQGGVLLGGGRHLDIAGETTASEGLTDLIQQDLEHLLRETILPGRPFTITQRWSGTMGFRAKGKEPYVGLVSERVGAAVGLSGMGVAIGIRVARRAAGLWA